MNDTQTNEDIVMQIQHNIDNGLDCKELYTILFMNNKNLISIIVDPFAKAFNEPKDDLINEAYFGLVEAAKRFNYTNEVKFMTYAAYRIKQTVRRYLQETALVRYPAYLHEDAYKYRNIVDDYFAQYGVTPTAKYIQDRYNIPISKQYEYKRVLKDIDSLDRPINNDEAGDELCLMDTIADSNDFEEALIDTIADQQISAQIHAAMDKLSERDRTVIIETVFKQKTLAQTAAIMNVNTSRVRQLKHKAIRTLYNANKKLFDNYLQLSCLMYRTSLSRFKNSWSSVEEDYIIRKLELQMGAAK